MPRPKHKGSEIAYFEIGLTSGVRYRISGDRVWEIEERDNDRLHGALPAVRGPITLDAFNQLLEAEKERRDAED